MSLAASTEVAGAPLAGAGGRRATVVEAGFLTALVGVAWWETDRQARSMSSMVQGLAQIGRAMPFTTGALPFMGMWVTMMAAMMVPAVAPTVVRQRPDSRQAGQPLSGVLFLAGYLGVWACLGAAAFAALTAMGHLSGPDTWIGRAGGAAFVLIGLYQFTPWKAACLRACRRRPGGRSGTGGPPAIALTAGIADGLSCVGACGALMSVLLVVGVMDLKSMMALAVVIVLERHGRVVSATGGIVGSAVVAIGVAVLAHPPLLNSLATVAHHGPLMS
jgi:predicted metal-binding membrane protein